ncbi:MAG: hypothetical protein PHO53_04600, partial [Actinomycetota bacterium]|nr:hypothetical protein [Actinomycetota bacterium]
LSSATFSTLVSSDEPIVAERAMYFDYHGIDGGHDTAGATSPSSAWYLAEGYTAEEFDSYILLMNPQEEKTKVKATFLRADGTTLTTYYHIGAKSRATIKVDDIPGFESCEFSTKLETTSSTGIIAERSIYFNYQGKWAGGHNTMGVNEPQKSWYFAEGYTGY